MSSNIPRRGDHIRVLRSLGYYHHGVFVSNNKVIHFTTAENDGILDWSKAVVMQTDLQQFWRGGELEIVKHDANKLYPVDDIVEYAHDCVGDTGYNLFRENCEHFANECVIVEHRSKQSDGFIGALKTAADFAGDKVMGLFGTIASTALDIFDNIFSSPSSSSGRKPAKIEKVKLEEVERDRQIKLAEIERDKQIKLAEIERDKQMNLDDKQAARAKIERDTQIKLAALENERLQAEHAAHMAEAAQREKLAEVERDRQIKLAEIERDKSLSLADKEAARLKIERDTQIKLLQEQTRSRMAEAEQQARLKELETEMQLRLIDKDEERIRLMRDAQAELIKMQTMSQIAIERARVEGMTEIANQLVALQDKMLDVAQKRIAIIEAGALPIVREIENFYAEVGKKIQTNRDEYNTKKLPQLLKLLGQYERGTPEHAIFFAQILADRERHEKFIDLQIANVSERQNLVLQSFLSSKEKILVQTNQTVQYLVAEVAASFSRARTSSQALPTTNFKALPASN